MIFFRLDFWHSKNTPGSASNIFECWSATMNDRVNGYRFADLLERRIVSSRSDLHRKQRVLGFPLPVKTGERAAWFAASEVHEWLRSRAALRDATNHKPKE
jgi:predicted DNA-binding transcriptional regulator AlpA